MSDLLARVTALALAAKKASRAVALAPTAVRDRALRAAAAALRGDEAAILAANAEDLALARAKGLAERQVLGFFGLRLRALSPVLKRHFQRDLGDGRTIAAIEHVLQVPRGDLRQALGQQCRRTIAQPQRGAVRHTA